MVDEEHAHIPPLTMAETEFLRATMHWWLEDPKRIEASRRLVREASELIDIVEGRRFWRRMKRHLKTFAGWLAGFVAFLVAFRDLLGLGKH